MFSEANAPHHRAHFHAYYQDQTAIYAIDPIELIAGEMPRRQARLIEAWAEVHQEELAEDWNRLQAGHPAFPIKPLS